MRHGNRGELALTGVRLVMYVFWSGFMAFTTVWFLVTLDSIAASMKLTALTKTYKDAREELSDEDQMILVEKIGKRVRRGSWKTKSFKKLMHPAETQAE